VIAPARERAEEARRVQEALEETVPHQRQEGVHAERKCAVAQTLVPTPSVSAPYSVVAFPPIARVVARSPRSESISIVQSRSPRSSSGARCLWACLAHTRDSRNVAALLEAHEDRRLPALGARGSGGRDSWAVGFGCCVKWKSRPRAQALARSKHCVAP